MFSAEAQEKGLALRIVPSTAIISAEPLSLMRMVSNIVSNAIKYTDTGRVLMGCRRKADMLSIEVHDTGPGLSETEIAHVLQPYARMAHDSGGTGLGLSVVSQLAETQNLGFHISSQPTRGSIFRIEAPLSSRDNGAEKFDCKST